MIGSRRGSGRKRIDIPRPNSYRRNKKIDNRSVNSNRRGNSNRNRRIIIRHDR